MHDSFSNDLPAKPSDLRILFEDEFYIAIDKESGMHVHPHEDPRHRVHRSQIALFRLRDQIQTYLYPIHRLDAATSGVLIFAKDSPSAAAFQQLLQQKSETKKVQKKYWAIVRGWTKDTGEINLDLELDSTREPVPALTFYRRLRKMEIPTPVGKKHSSARYSWCEVEPHTGRFHQIRRHFNRISHPLIGDPYHGDSHHNRFFREQMSVPGLCLRAYQLEFDHPITQQRIVLDAGSNAKWDFLEQLFQKFSSL